jgi:hypothetical protein
MSSRNNLRLRSNSRNNLRLRSNSRNNLRLRSSNNKDNNHKTLSLKDNLKDGRRNIEGRMTKRSKKLLSIISVG